MKNTLLIVSALVIGLRIAAGEAILDPEEERKLFEVADGFEVNLFASDPQMAKPIQINFDAQGRLWVASSETYPQVKPGEVPNDKIIVLEDSTGSGKADKVTVFADHLFIPTGILPGNGGVYVANSTQLLHLKYSDGDGKADLRRVVLDGFGTEDTHHILHTLRWGMDGRMYLNQSVYIHAHIETPYGVKRLNAGGTWRFNPDTLEMEVLSQGMVNHWGHSFTKWGESLMTDGAYGEGVNFVFPGATFFWAHDLNQGAPARILKGMSTGQPKYAGMEIVSGRHFPDDWQGDVITNDFRASRIVRFKLSEEGSGYSAKLMPQDVIRLKSAKGSGNGMERVFRPIDLKMGPDGALYIADWFNPIIQHGEVDFRDPRRDHTHGRIWRLTAKGRPLVERPKLAAMKTSELLDQLDLRRSPEDYTRAMARRVLIEKGPAEVLPALKNWVNGMSVNDEKVDRTHEQLEALWLYQALNEVEPALLKQMLTVRDARARAAATRVLRDWHPRIPNALELLATLIHDESPRVRLEAICALEAIPDLRSLEIALRALDMPRDANIDFALYHACNTLKAQWLPGVENGSYTFGGNVHALSFALQSVGSKAGVGPLLKLLKEDKIARENREDVVGLITGMGGPPELSALMQIQRDARSNNLRAIIFTALARAASERNIRPQDTKSPAVLRMLEQYLQNATPPLDPEVCAAAARLAGAWKLDELREPLERMANTTLAPAVQLAVMDALTALGTHPRTLEILTRLLYQGAPAVVARAAVKLLALDKPDAVNFAANVLKNPLGNSAQEIFAAYSKKEDVAKQLVAALQVKGIAPENADAGLRYFNASGQNSPELIQFLKTTIQAQAAGASNSPQVAGKKPSELSAVMLADEKKSLAAADMQALIADVQQHGDPARGEKIFRRGTLSCFSCHAIGGAGGQVGPDLSSVGAASQLDYVIDSVLSPNKNVKEGYNSLTVVTKNREVFTGNMVRQTATHLILRDGMRDEIPIPVGEVLRKRESGSLMPSGLADSLTRGELVDLIRFLSELGKPGPFSTAQSTAIRRFRTLDPVPPEIMFENPAAVPAVLAKASNLTWLPFYPTASGAVPHADLLTGKNRYIAFLRFELNVLTPGKISLRVRSPGIVNLWLNDAVLDPNASVVDVPKGLCQFTLRVDKHVKPDIGPNDGLKVEVEELAGSPARFQRVVGK